MAEFDELPNVSDAECRQPAPITNASETSLAKKCLGVLAWAYGWIVCVFCGLILLAAVVQMALSEMDWLAGSVLSMIVVLASCTGWRIRRFGRMCLQTPSVPVAASLVQHNTPEISAHQTAPRFALVALWAIVAMLCVLMLLGCVAFVARALHEGRALGFVVFLSGWGLLSAGCLFGAAKKCVRAYRAYDAVQRRW